jgi:hypothetical protein
MTFLEFMNLFVAFRGVSWSAWRDVFALVTAQIREVYLIVGRGAGKTMLTALYLLYRSVNFSAPLMAGENVFAVWISPDRRQSALALKLVKGFLHAVPALERLIISEKNDSIELTNGVVIEIVTASVGAPRGRSYLVVILEEAAFFPQDTSANPDVELLRAVRPGLARVPGSVLLVISSPYARRGILWDAFRKYHAVDGGDVLVVQKTTLDLNPTFDQQAIARAYEEDPASAAAEYGAQFRSDIEGFVGIDALIAVTAPSRAELPPIPNTTYFGFFDGAGGSGQDSAAMGIAHVARIDGRDVAVLDVLREVRPKFSPADVVAEFAAVLQSYGVTRVTGDRWAGEWPREHFRAHGVEYFPADRTASEFYLEFLAIVNSKRCELLDHKRFQLQVSSLERRTSRDGRDKVGHPLNGHDDIAVVGAAVIVLAAAAAARPTLQFLNTGAKPMSVDEINAEAQRDAQDRREMSERDVAQAIAENGVYWP